MTTLSKYCTEVKFVVAVDTSIQGACVVHFVRMVKQCNVCLIGRHDHNTLVPISEAMATTSHAYLHTTAAANPYSVLLLHMTTLHSNTAKNKILNQHKSCTLSRCFNSSVVRSTPRGLSNVTLQT